MTTHQNRPRLVHGLSARLGTGLTMEQIIEREQAEAERRASATRRHEATRLAAQVEQMRPPQRHTPPPAPPPLKAKAPTPAPTKPAAEVKRFRIRRRKPTEPDEDLTLTPADIEALARLVRRERARDALTKPPTRKDS